MESAIKITGLGWRWYFYDRWNMFDFIVVVLSIGITIVDVINRVYDCSPKDPSNSNALFVITKKESPGFEFPQVLRALRIGRVLRLVRRLKGLRQMIETLFVSLPSLYTIMLLMILIMIIFSVLGVNLFSNVNMQQDGNERITEIANYVYWDNAFFMLFRQTTGE
ncbi:Ion transport domain-containing protein, partial [Baffinella frigidus]